MRVALVAGASGLVGSPLLPLLLLLEDPTWDRVVSLGRRPPRRQNPGRVEHVVELTDLAGETEREARARRAGHHVVGAAGIARLSDTR